MRERSILGSLDSLSDLLADIFFLDSSAAPPIKTAWLELSVAGSSTKSAVVTALRHATLGAIDCPSSNTCLILSTNFLAS